MESSGTDEDVCFFNCSNTNRKLITSGSKRIENIVESSKRRGDGLHITLTGRQTIGCHKSCVSSYTSEQHITRFLSSTIKNTSDIEVAAPKKARRSESTSFCFKENCLFCGERCVPLPSDCRNPARWRRVTQCRTARNFKQNIIQVCDSRGDSLSDSVRVRVNGALSDLHEADGQYHRYCYKSFMSHRNVSSARTNVDQDDDDTDNAFIALVGDMTEDKAHVWNYVEVE